MDSMTQRIKLIHKVLFAFAAMYICASSFAHGQEFRQKSKRKGNPLLVCLGNEEERLHLSKTSGPIYRLNQLFINEFAGANDIRLKNEYLKQTCASKSFSPSVVLLRLLVIKGTSIFELGELDLHQKGMAEDLTERSGHIFFSYLAGLQGLTADPQCLNKKIPEIKEFSDRFQYLESDISEQQILHDNKKIDHIFNKLKNFNKIMQECEKEARLEREKRNTVTQPKN